MTEQGNSTKPNKVRYTRRAKVVGALAATGALVGVADFITNSINKDAAFHGRSIESQLNAAGHAGSPSPETPTPSPTEITPASVERPGVVRHGEVANQALIVKAVGEAIELHADANSGSKVVGTVPAGQSIVLERNLGQVNSQAPGKHFWIGGTPDNTTAGHLEWVDTSKLPGNAIASYYPAAGAPETVDYEEAYGVFTGINFDGPVAAVVGPMSEAQALQRVEADGFKAPSVD